MKFTKILPIFLIFSVLNSVLGTILVSENSSNDINLSNFVCKIIKAITKTKNDTQDVLVGNLGGKLWSSTVNDIAGCVGRGSAVVVSNFGDLVTEKTLRKATVVVLGLKDLDKVKLYLIYLKNLKKYFFRLKSHQS